MNGLLIGAGVAAIALLTYAIWLFSTDTSNLDGAVRVRMFSASISAFGLSLIAWIVAWIRGFSVPEMLNGPIVLMALVLSIMTGVLAGPTLVGTFFLWMLPEFCFMECR